MGGQRIRGEILKKYVENYINFIQFSKLLTKKPNKNVMIFPYSLHNEQFF